MWATLAEELATHFPFDALEDPSAITDASGGRYAPNAGDTAAGTVSNTPPDESPQPRDRPEEEPRERPGNDDPHDDHEEFPQERTNREHVRDMWESIVIDGILGVLGNIAFAPVTEAVSIGSDAGEALGRGVIELDKNYHEDMGALTGHGGSSKSGREAWDAIAAESRTKPFDRGK